MITEESRSLRATGRAASLAHLAALDPADHEGNHAEEGEQRLRRRSVGHVRVDDFRVGKLHGRGLPHLRSVCGVLVGLLL